MGCTADLTCFKVFPLWQGWHSLHQAAMSLDMPVHTKRDEMARLVALVPECAKACRASKMIQRCGNGTSGRTRPVEVSHKTPTPSTVTIRTFRVGEQAAACVSTQLRCASATVAKSMTDLSSTVPAAIAGLVATSAITEEDEGEEGNGLLSAAVLIACEGGGGLDNVSATTLAVPATYLKSLVYSAM
jgi:hypothetical protein